MEKYEKNLNGYMKTATRTRRTAHRARLQLYKKILQEAKCEIYKVTLFIN